MMKQIRQGAAKARVWGLGFIGFEDSGMRAAESSPRLEFWAIPFEGLGSWFALRADTVTASSACISLKVQRPKY